MVDESGSVSPEGKWAWLRKLAHDAVFPAHDAINCAVIRILSGGYILYHLLRVRRYFMHLVRSDSRPFKPSGLAKLLGAPLDPVVHDVLLAVTIGLAFCFVLGIAYRYTAPAFAILLACVLSYRNSFGFIYHTTQLMVIHSLALSFAPAADRLSVDAGLRWYFGERKGLGAVLGRRVSAGPHWRYGWPVQLSLFLTGITYWLAGVAKLDRGGGIHWATDAVLLQHIANNAFRYIFLEGKVNEWTYTLYGIDPRWVAALAMGSLVIELTAPLMIVHRRVTYLFAIALWCFHRGILEFMDIPFVYQLSGAAFVAFVRWDLVFAFSRGLASRWVPGLAPRPANAGDDSLREGDDPPRPVFSKIHALVVSAGLGLVFASPGLRGIVSDERIDDDYMLSTYAMFSQPRAEPQRITYVRAVGDDVEPRIVLHYFWADGGMNSALTNLGRLRRQKKTSKVCRRAAAKIKGHEEFAKYRGVQVVSDRYFPRTYFGERQSAPHKRRIHTRCTIKRPPS